MNSSTSTISIYPEILPALVDKPSLLKLCDVLERLELGPKSWQTSTRLDTSTQESKVITDYLLSIISSNLNWIGKEDGDDIADIPHSRDLVWELASKRLAERCGRYAMPEVTRTWVIPRSSNLPEMQFAIREPPLTGDSLGLKTWGTAFAMAKKLEELYSLCFEKIPGEKNDSLSSIDIAHHISPEVLELGSGTGLFGIAIAAVWQTSVLLTDLEDIISNLSHNSDNNKIPWVLPRGGNLAVDILDWNNPNDSFSELQLANHKFTVVVAADPLYDDEHPYLVARMIRRYLRVSSRSRALISIPIRDAKTKSLAADLTGLMVDFGFQLCHQGEEVFYDDWGDIDVNEGVKCWWGIWKLSVKQEYIASLQS